MLVGMGNPLGTRNPHGYGFGQNFIPVMGMGFLAGVFFLRGYGFGQVIPSGFLPIAISSSSIHSAARGPAHLATCTCCWAWRKRWETRWHCRRGSVDVDLGVAQLLRVGPPPVQRRQALEQRLHRWRGRCALPDPIHAGRAHRAHVANPVTICIPNPCDYMYPQSIFIIVHHYMRLENYSFLFKKDHVYDETIT
jgi:hypothetical protein